MPTLDTSESLDNDTSEHARQVQACNNGTDIREASAGTPVWGPTKALGIRGFASGHFWEPERPLEASTPAPPRFELPQNFQARRGQFNRWGAGKHAVGFLAARRSF
jgi:hypothetical protein